MNFRYPASALFLLPKHMDETYFNALRFSYKFQKSESGYD